MNEEERREALYSRESDEDSKKRLVLQNAFLPLDLVLRIIANLPSQALFDFRRLCKAAYPRALLALAHRPFFVVQQNPPSSLCYLLPLDLPCSPLPCSFNIAKPSFRLLLASGNLLCLYRQYALLLDICVCNIFRKWKIVLPPIVHPSFASHISRHILLEDANVEFLRVVGFHAAQPTLKTDEEEVFSPGYRIFVASTAYLRVFDSHVNQWSGPVYFPSHLKKPPLGSAGQRQPPLGFATSDGNLILTFSRKARAVFNYEDQSFHAVERHFLHPAFEVAGYPASAQVDSSFKLKVRLPHVEECVRSSPIEGLVLEGSCKNDLDLPYRGSSLVYINGVPHSHQYSRNLLRSFCHAYQGKVYALVMERDELHCFTEEPMEFVEEPMDCNGNPELVELGWDFQSVVPKHNLFRPLMISSKCEGKHWQDLHSLDVEKCLHPDEDSNFDCTQFFPACSPPKLTLYSACIDTTDWTMKVFKEADASACLEVFDNKGGTLSFISG